MADSHRVLRETRMRYANYLADSIEASVGIYGVTPRFQPPAQSPVDNHIMNTRGQGGGSNSFGPRM
jgi:hypothetical protein